MEIRIQQLKLTNFKGVREAAFDFGGGNVTVEGDNGTGKSTLMDAFCWLLFGKDRNGSEQFEIKTIDPATREPIAKLDHEVEAVLTVDGARKTLRRVWQENWVTPRGEIEQVMKGHNTLFFVDGVNVGTKTAYDSVIHQWMDEKVFKMVTNPLYLIDDNYTGWKARREVVLGLADGEVDRSALLEQFADLVKEMDGENIESFKKRIAALKKENRKSLAECGPKIKGLMQAMPAEVDEEGVNAQLREIEAKKAELKAESEARIRDIEARIADVNKANDARNAESSAINERITKIMVAQEALVRKGLEDATRANGERRVRITETATELSEVNVELMTVDREIAAMQKRLADAAVERTQLAAMLKTLGGQYQAEKDRAFDYVPTTTCPTCGQELPADSVAEAMEKAREAYAATRKEALGAIVRKADKIKTEIRDLDVDIASKQSRLAELQGRGQALAARRDEAAQAVEAAKAAPTMDTEGMERAIKMGDEYQDLANEAEELRSQLLSIASGMDSAADWVNEMHKEQDACGRALARLQGQELPLHSSLGMVAERERVQGLIAEEEVREKNLAAEVARLERLEYEAASFVKADIESQEDAVNALFRVARFRMFDYTLDGGAVETCECTTQQGVRYGSMNDARKIQCGMDVIRVLSERYGVSAPIFIDNAESITQREFDNDAQVIRLVVKAGSELTIINE